MKIKQHLVQIYLLGTLLSAASTGWAHAQVLLGSQGLGADTNGFGFSVSGATNVSVVVEAATNLTTPLPAFWMPLATNTLSNGFFYFSDPQWTNYSRRFYRVTGTNAFGVFTVSPASGTVPLTVQFNSRNFDSLGNPITSWNWNFGDGATSSAQNPSHVYTNIGAFNPGFVATNNLGVAMTGSGPQISALSTAAFTANFTNGATPFAVQFNSPNVDSLGFAITSWNWNFGDGATSSAQNPSHIYTNIGAFNPGFVATNSFKIRVIGSGPQIVVFSFLTATNNGVTAITGFVGKPAGVLTIPAAINGLPVTSIGESAFSGCAGVTSVTIPNTVTGIGLRAFYDCPGLTNVIIPDSVTGIGDYAFSSCGRLSNVVIGNGVTNLGNFVFAFCPSLAGITIPNGVTGIGTEAFGCCTGLTSVTIPDSVTCLGDFAFGSCVNLTNVVIGNGVTNLGNFAFAFCDNLTGVVIPGNVASIGSSAFVSCSNLASATVDGSNVGDFAFSSCGSLGSVVFGNGVTNLGNFAFAYCSSLTGIIIPGQVGSVGVDAFASCGNLASATIDGGNIGDYAFSSCGSLSSVVFGSGVTNIGVGAFAGCSNLTNVTIPGTVSDIGGGAFSSCANLAQVTIGDGVNRLGYAAFSDNANLQAVYFQGNAPTFLDANGPFNGANAAAAKIYCLPGTAGWNPQMQTGDGNFGVKTNQFGFDVSCNNNLSVIVEACTNLNQPVWLPVATNQGSFYFSDSQWMNYPVRFYRLLVSGFAGLPVTLWNPEIQTGDGRFGVRSNQFGFTITGAANIPVVVEACTNLANAMWVPLFNGLLTNGSVYFSDPAWRDYPGRFYRISSQ
ncbi:MAG TPA: leucine-rich repeat protein [Verrucomicrobiae bacterium]|nr:leucine-rich repeat protein [Verrucomicrobiae bacterium]